MKVVKNCVSCAREFVISILFFSFFLKFSKMTAYKKHKILLANLTQRKGSDYSDIRVSFP